MSRLKLTVCIVALLSVGVLLFFAARAEARERPGRAPEIDKAEPVDADADTVCGLFLGCDRAAGLTDCIWLVCFSGKTGAVRLLQLPRDTYAAYTDRDYRKLNGAYNALGLSGVREWLAAALGVRIDFAVAYDLECVRNTVDAIGGVVVEIPQDMRYSDPEQGLEIDLPAGKRRLSGQEAEQFVRFRAGYPDADLGRLQAQRLFLEAFVQTLCELPATRLAALCASLLPTVQTDLSAARALTLTALLVHAPALTLTAEVAPGAPVQGDSGAWYYVLNRAEMICALHRWSLGNVLEFDPNLQFDRPENDRFHTIYTATNGVP